MSETAPVILTDHQRALLPVTIPEALDRAAQAWPSKVALSFVASPERFTWAQLRDTVARLRTGLENIGVRPGDKVGIMIPNQAEFPLAWLAVIEAGAVAVPFNPRYTRREAEYVLSDAGASWLVITRELVDQHGVAAFAPVPPGNVIVAGDPPAGAHALAALLATPQAPRRHQAQGRDLVGIQFTSGTTGLPKGCLLTHEYWLHLGVYGAAMFGNAEHLLADHPFYYMQNQAYFMTALTSGGQLHITPGLSRSKFMSWLIDHDIDFAWIDEDLLNLPPSADDRRLKLKKAPVAGLPGELHRALEERFGLRAREWYASTEIGNGTIVSFERDDLVGSGCMGLCCPGRESKIIGPDLRELPPGEPGELCFRGPGIMLGYHNRPEVNAELFLPGGWFRTGDVARKTADGLHYYQGRMRDMVRRSGENISAAEVEQQIATMPGVLDVGVIPVPDPDRGEEVKALIVARPGARLTAGDVIAWLGARLAPFKIPRYVEFRDELPHTESGKIAKSALRAEAPLTAATVDVRHLPVKP